MDAKEVLANIRVAVEHAKGQGQETVRIQNVELLIEDIENQIDAQPYDRDLVLARFNAEHESNLAHYRAINQYDLEQFRTIIQSGQAALKSAVLINGGAAVALLAFLGHVWGREPAHDIVSGLSRSLLYFVWGVLAAAFASGTTYMANNFSSAKWSKTAAMWNWISVLLVVLSYLLFAFGSYTSYLGFLSH